MRFLLISYFNKKLIVASFSVTWHSKSATRFVNKSKQKPLSDMLLLIFLVFQSRAPVTWSSIERSLFSIHLENSSDLYSNAKIISLFEIGLGNSAKFSSIFSSSDSYMDTIDFGSFCCVSSTRIVLTSLPTIL